MESLGILAAPLLTETLLLLFFLTLTHFSCKLSRMLQAPVWGGKGGTPYCWKIWESCRQKSAENQSKGAHELEMDHFFP